MMDFKSENVKVVLAFVIAFCLAVVVTNYFISNDTKVSEAKGRKAEIQTQIAVQNQQRTGLQKAVWEAFDKGLHETNQVEKSKSRDNENIQIIVIALPDSVIEKLFKDRYGEFTK